MANTQTLLIGLGGTGCTIVDKVYSMLDSSQRENVIVHAFDTVSIKELAHMCEKVTQKGSHWTVTQKLEREWVLRSWFPDYKPTLRDLFCKSLTGGAGQIRMISRLALHSAIVEGRLNKSVQKISQLFLDREKNTRIIIVWALAGGTGSGTLMKPRELLTCYFGHDEAPYFLPDILVQTQTSGLSELPLICANTHAFFNEFETITKGGSNYLGTTIELNSIQEFYPSNPGTRHLADWVNPNDLAEVGWSVIFHEGEDDGIRKALAPLLEHRRGMAGKRFRELVFRATDRANPRAFFERYRIGRDDVDPRIIPYLLIVGSPEAIPFEFQYGLDLIPAVGRLYFKDVSSYSTYAENVVKNETSLFSRSRSMTLLGAENDSLTELRTNKRTSFLAEKLAKKIEGWDFETVTGLDATKDRLKHLMGGSQTSELLSSMGNAVFFRKDTETGYGNQGSLVISDRYRLWRMLERKHYLSPDDVSESIGFRGKIDFCFDCYSGGTPEFDDFAGPGKASRLHEKTFVSPLAKPRLGYKRGLLAGIGHVDKAKATVDFSGQWLNTDETYMAEVSQFETNIKNGFSRVKSHKGHRFFAWMSQMSSANQPTRFFKNLDHTIHMVEEKRLKGGTKTTLPLDTLNGRIKKTNMKYALKNTHPKVTNINFSSHVFEQSCLGKYERSFDDVKKGFQQEENGQHLFPKDVLKWYGKTLRKGGDSNLDLAPSFYKKAKQCIVVSRGNLNEEIKRLDFLGEQLLPRAVELNMRSFWDTHPAVIAMMGETEQNVFFAQEGIVDGTFSHHEFVRYHAVNAIKSEDLPKSSKEIETTLQSVGAYSSSFKKTICSFTFHNDSKEEIKESCKKISTLNGKTVTPEKGLVQVLIITSLQGGTGSGMFLDFVAILSEIWCKRMMIQNLISLDLFLNGQPPGGLAMLITYPGFKQDSDEIDLAKDIIVHRMSQSLSVQSGTDLDDDADNITMDNKSNRLRLQNILNMGSTLFKLKFYKIYTARSLVKVYPVLNLAEKGSEGRRQKPFGVSVLHAA